MCYHLLPEMSFHDTQILLRQIKSDSMRHQAMTALADSQRLLYETRMKAFEEARKRVGKMTTGKSSKPYIKVLRTKKS